MATLVAQGMHVAIVLSSLRKSCFEVFLHGLWHLAVILRTSKLAALAKRWRRQLRAGSTLLLFSSRQGNRRLGAFKTIFEGFFLSQWESTFEVSVKQFFELFSIRETIQRGDWSVRLFVFLCVCFFWWGFFKTKPRWFRLTVSVCKCV